ncbi:MAG: hypothetical protein ACFBWO_14005 [Paracoccaceae bacterium]
MLPATHPTLEHRKVAEGFWSVVVAEGHPLVFVERVPSPALHASWMARFRAAGVDPRTVLDTARVRPVDLALAHGLLRHRARLGRRARRRRSGPT